MIPLPLAPSLRTVLIRDEGFKEQPYKDLYGNWTIGVGYFIGKNIEDLKLSREVILQMLDEKLNIHFRDACEIFGQDFFLQLEPARQVAIVSIIYTVGKSRFLRFKDTIYCISMKDWEGAAKNLLDSKWAHDVDPRDIPDKGRDDRIAFMLREGRFHEEYHI